MDVNSLSNKLVSREPVTVGSQGGEMAPAASASQSVTWALKKGWPRTSSASVGPLPKRSAGSRRSRPVRMPVASRLRYFGKVSSADLLIGLG